MPIIIPIIASNGALATVTAPNPVVQSSQQPVSLFTTQVPAQTGQDDGFNYELGMKFQATVVGNITGIRFWKSPGETGAHTGKIYSAAGALLASVAFTGETASGWQVKSLATPLPILANTTYVVSVNTGTNEKYVATTSGLASQIVNGVLRSVVGSNGVYGSVGSMPTQSYQSSNYFRDVVFVPTGTSPPADTQAPSIPTNLIVGVQ